MKKHLSQTLINFDQHPNFEEIEASAVSEVADLILEQAKKKLHLIINETASPTWDNVCQPIEVVSESISRVWGQVEHLCSVNGTSEWREAYQKNLPKIVAFYTEWSQKKELYERVLDLSLTPAYADFSELKKKVIQDRLRDFKLGGVALPNNKQSVFSKNVERQAALAAVFDENLLKATHAFTLIVKEEKVLGEMPDDLRHVARQLGQNKGVEGWCFNLQAPSYLACMQYVTDRYLRMRMHFAYSTRASEFGPSDRDNTPIIGEMLSLRRQQASLLDYSNYAEMALTTKMASSAKVIEDFLTDLINQIHSFAQQDIERLRHYASSVLGIDDLQIWDLSFVTEKLRHQQFDYSETELRQYLRTDKIIQGLFSCVQKLFGVQLQKKSVPVWNEDVVYYQLLTNSGEEIGGVYFDLYARQNKRGGAWMADGLSRYHHHGHTQLPIAYITCNFSKPVTPPGVLSWEEVVTLFHEFGHALHHLLTEVDVYSVSGISGVEWDAVELPSQWFENFAWDWDVLQPMTEHIETSHPIPKLLFDKLLQARHFNSGLKLLRQINFALFDLSLHNDNERTVTEAILKVRQIATVFPPPDYDRFYCGFSHIFSGGYATGYYSYLWSEVLAVNIFSLFKQSTLILNPEIGKKFREQILAVGGGRPAMESFVAMFGQEPDSSALLSHYGLSTE